MAYDHLGIFFIQSQEIHCSLGYEAVAGSVESVSSHFVILVVLQRQTVQVCFRRHSLMESGIEYCHLRHAGISSAQTLIPIRFAGL